METLSPAEASPIAGVPVAQLLRWAYERVGPKNVGTKHKPRYREMDVKAWRASHTDSGKRLEAQALSDARMGGF